MDKQLRGYYGSMNIIKYEEETNSSLSDRSFITLSNVGRTCMDQNFFNLSQFPPDLNPGVISPSGFTTESDSHEDCDFSDVVLKYINQMLMEEDMEEKTCMFQESAVLQAAESYFAGTNMVPGMKTGQRKKTATDPIASPLTTSALVIVTPQTLSDETQPPNDTQTFVEETQAHGIGKSTSNRVCGPTVGK
ncbi:Scarecrow-like protein 33 [Camellia lanceoleosa]|uniref:Scarecrow-like protein 33 n=1 Tax=Camellia lanceoleosa TaxID=1840588 RepID=A0ACC0F4R2_9ERIC|nr:Scarecrow-like protein 33 [Camellia lanceoleosa]